MFDNIVSELLNQTGVWSAVVVLIGFFAGKYLISSIKEQKREITDMRDEFFETLKRAEKRIDEKDKQFLTVIDDYRRLANENHEAIRKFINSSDSLRETNQTLRANLNRVENLISQINNK